jgi:hypothetical protein
MSITRAEVHRIRAAAAAKPHPFGSRAFARVRTCDRALDGDRQALYQCERYRDDDDARARRGAAEDRELAQPFARNEARILVPLLGALALALWMKHRASA